MQKIKAILFSRWTLSLIAVALLAALVWVFGPFLALLESWLPRAVIILVMFALWAGVNLGLDWRQKRRDRALAEGVAAVDASATAAAEETAALRERLTRALTLLRRAHGKRGWLHQQPWYVIIGPPGAGKTTALLNSGLRFPLADEMGHEPVAGVGGTRLCDWWFTDDAVLIDTAGRYTTQDSNPTVDRAGWETFLDLLKRTRTRQPLNGVIVAIGLADIAQSPREERLAHANAIRRRLKELREKLGIELPVYLLFTKADLIGGFSEFFDDLDREKRAQVWGTTFPLDASSSGQALGQFAASFQGLIERLDARRLDRLQAERSPDRRALIAGFPAQLASLSAPLGEFIEAGFAGSRLDPAPLLRGVYLSSGTQEGTPIDRLTGLLARGFGIDQRRAPSLRPEHGRSYFLTRLLRQVVLGEAMLVAEPPRLKQKRLLLRSGGYAAVALATLAACGWLWHQSSTNRAKIDTLSAGLAHYQQVIAQLPMGLDRVADSDLVGILPALDAARDLPFGATTRSGSDFGLAQESKLHAAAEDVYRNALQRLLLPRLIWRLENQLRGALNQPDFAYQATRVYLMLGGQGPLDRDLVRAWMKLDWERAYPGATSATMRQDLADHLDHLLAEPLPQIALDGGLVDAARVTFSRVSTAERVYARIVPSAAAQRLPGWSPADALGPSGAPLFIRNSGKPLSEGVPGFYTAAGFQTVLLPMLPITAKQVADESWLLGKQSTIDTSPAALQALEAQVIHLYEQDYIRQWDGLFADLSLAPDRGPQQAVEALYVLGSPQSPLRKLLASAVEQLNLAPPAAPAAAGNALQTATKALQAVLAPPAAAATEVPGQEVDAHYRALRDYVGQGAGAPIDTALAAINALQQSLAALTAPAGAAPATPPTTDPNLALRAAANAAPQPVQHWLLALAGDGTALRQGGLHQQAASAFNSSGGPASLCTAAVRGRYPFVAAAKSDIPLEDFTRLFAPSGMLDKFFAAQLQPFVDTTAPVWKARAVDGVASPLSAKDIDAFQRAAALRQIFFAGGASTPSASFEITPVSLDAGTKQVILDLGGSSVSYAHGPLRATTITWPAQGSSSARLVFDPPAAGAPVIQASGPWALFRLIGAGTLQQDGTPDHYTLTFVQGGHRAVFAIHTASVINPFASSALRDFQCPTLH